MEHEQPSAASPPREMGYGEYLRLYEAVSEPGKRDATLLDALVRISSSSCGGAASPFLRRADQQLVDGHAPRAGHDVGDGIRDILRREELDASPAPLELLTHFFPGMASELGRHESWLDHADAHVPFCDLLPQRFAGRPHAQLGHVVHSPAGPCDTPGLGADIDQVGDAA